MKQKVRVLLLVVCMLLATCCIFVACNKDNKGNSDDVTVTLSQQTLSLDLYEPATLEATVTGSTADPAWSSSDSATVSVDQNGNIVGLKEGSATITASVGGQSAECVVTVDETGTRPSFVGLSTSLELGVNGEQTLAPTVEYKGKTLSGLTISYATEDTEYITVSDDGKITAVKVTPQNDSAIVTVSAPYYDWTVSATVKVTVKDDVTVSLDVSTIALYISAPTDEFATTHQLDVTITDNGTDITSLENVTFTSSDSESVSVSDEGLISAVKLTTEPVTITVTYTSVAGQDFTATCTVTVSKASVEVDTETTEVEIDVLDTSSETVALPLANLTAVYEDVAVEDVISVSDTENAVTFTITASDASVLLKKSEIYSGKTTYALETADCIYEIPVLMITKILETPDDLDKMKDYSLTDPATDADAYYFMGYFELGNDIDYNKTIPAWCGYEQIGGNNESIGFMGTFDGKNHVISGMTVANNNSGFIGTIGTFGVVKNVAFVNAYLANQGTGVVAGFVNGKVENVIVHGTRGVQTANWGPSGMICMKTGETSAAIRNVLVIMEDMTFGEWDAVIIGRNDAGGAVLLENAYGICFADGAPAYIVDQGDGNMSNTSGYTNVLLKKTLAGLLSDENADFSGFTGWADDTTFGVPLPDKIADLLETRDDLVYSVRITNENTEAYSGTTQVTVINSSDAAVEYSIKETLAGIAIDPSTGVITVTGTDMAEDEVQFTVVATIGDGEFDTWETTFTAYFRNLEAIDQTADVSLDMLADDGNVEITIEGLSTVSKVLNGTTGEELDGFSQSEDTVTIPLNQFANFTTGERYVSILDETTRYNVLVTVYATITTKDQFIGMEKYLTADGDTLTGIIYLGDNIDLEGAAYNGIGEYTGSAGSYVFTDKWAGTFDGKGYTLSNFKITEDFGSMFAYITSEGSVTNLAIVGATIDGAKGGIVATLNEGEISDIFVKGKILNGDGSGDTLNGSYTQPGTTSTTLVTSTLSTSAVMKNIFAVLDDDWSYSPNSYGGVIIGVARCTAYGVRGEYVNVTNVYSINGKGRFVSSDAEDWLATGWGDWISSIGNEYGGRGVNRDTSDLNYLTDTDLIMSVDSDNPNAGKVVDSFSNGYGELAAWLAEGNEFSGFDSEYWTTLDGLGYPVFKTAAEKVAASYDTSAILALDASLKEVHMGDTVTLKNVSAYVEKFPATYTLKEEISGVTLVDNVLTVDNTVAEDTVITVVGNSALFPDANVESTIVVKKAIEYTDKDAVVIAKTDSDESITLDISGVVNADDVIAVSVENGEAEAEVTYSKATDTSLTLTLADITATSSGEKYIIVETADTLYYFPIILADEEIVDEEDLIAFEEKIYSYSKSEGDPPVPTEGSLTGYYVLTADIDLSESTHVFGGTVAYGFFDGTFNGLGHSITGMTTGDMGLFKNVQENGVIKNLAIIDAVSTIDQQDGGETPNGASIFAEYFHGTAQNIYISGTSGIGRWSYSGIFRQNRGTLIDCIFEVEQVSGVTIDVNATVLGYWDSSATASDVVLITSSTKIHTAGSSTAPTGVTLYADEATAASGIDLDGFDSTIWSKDDSGNILFNGDIVVTAANA